mmetsp:Transcript_28662/g.69315  ORF Transcript_28662/g.69315 Transcript_28662/m.69315 type:complete len:510 (-) Transcript_28662:60-1589(-)
MSARPSARLSSNLTPLLSSRRTLDAPDSGAGRPSQNAQSWRGSDAGMASHRSTFERRKAAAVPRTRLGDDRAEWTASTVKIPRTPVGRTRQDAPKGSKPSDARSRQSVVDRLHPSPPSDLEASYTPQTRERRTLGAAVTRLGNSQSARDISRAAAADRPWSPAAPPKSARAADDFEATRRETESGLAVVEQLVMQAASLRKTVHGLEDQLQAVEAQRDEFKELADRYQSRFESLQAHSDAQSGASPVSLKSFNPDSAQGIRDQLADTLETLAELRTQMAYQRDQTEVVASLRAEVALLRSELHASRTGCPQESADEKLQALQQETAVAITKAMDAEMSVLVAREECAQSDARRCDVERRNDDLEDRCRSLSSELSQMRKSSDATSLSGYGERSCSPDSGRGLSQELVQQRDRFAEENARLRAELQRSHVFLREAHKAETGQLNQRGVLLQELEELKNLRAELEQQTRVAMPTASAVKRAGAANGASSWDQQQSPALDFRSVLQRVQGHA